MGSNPTLSAKFMYASIKRQNNRSKRLKKKKIAKKGTENVKHLGKRYKEMRAMYFEMENNRNEWVGKEWVAHCRATKAERKVAKLMKQLLDNGITPE